MTSREAIPLIAHPPAPWTLVGDGLFVPFLGRSPLSPAGLYLARYGGGSTLAYHELILFPRVARHGRFLGAVITDILVDNPQSVAGGRAIWGLPKLLAEFEWSAGRVKVRFDGRDLVEVRWSEVRPKLPIWSPMPAFGQEVHFTGKLQGKFGLSVAQVEAPSGSPLAAALPTGRRPMFRLKPLVLYAPEPTRLGGEAP